LTLGEKRAVRESGRDRGTRTQNTGFKTRGREKDKTKQHGVRRFVTAQQPLFSNLGHPFHHGFGWFLLSSFASLPIVSPVHRTHGLCCSQPPLTLLSFAILFLSITLERYTVYLDVIFNGTASRKVAVLIIPLELSPTPTSYFCLTLLVDRCMRYVDILRE
jgi:hypothetical protein